MGRIWLWILIYAIVIGPMLSFLSFAMVWNLGVSPPRGIAYDIGQISSMVGLFAPMGGFLILIAGAILLKLRHTVDRMVSLIGMVFYYMGALGFVLAAALSRSPFWEKVVPVLAVVLLAGLPGLFFIRALRRAQKGVENTNGKD
jgi:hypothetical protein